MLALVLVIAFGVLVLLGRAGSWTRLKGEGWRVGAGMGALAVFAAAAFLCIRSAWIEGIALLVIGSGLAAAAKGPGRAVRLEIGLSRREAGSILGVEENAPHGEVKAAYTRLMRKARLAAQLNAARDVLLKS